MLFAQCVLRIPDSELALAGVEFTNGDLPGVRLVVKIKRLVPY